MSKKLNGYAKWTVLALFAAGTIFNAAILWNDVKHLKADVVEIKTDIRDVRNYLFGKD